MTAERLDNLIKMIAGTDISFCLVSTFFYKEFWFIVLRLACVAICTHCNGARADFWRHLSSGVENAR